MSSAQANLKRLGLILEEFRKIDPEMQMQKAVMLLLVAEAGENGIAVMALGDKAGLARASATRNVGMLGPDKDFKGRPGHGLVNIDSAVHDRREKVVTLSAKGKRVLSTIINILESK